MAKGQRQIAAMAADMNEMAKKRHHVMVLKLHERDLVGSETDSWF